MALPNCMQLISSRTGIRECVHQLPEPAIIFTGSQGSENQKPNEH